MAAHPPGPLPPDDGSGVFRKPSSKSAARKAPPPDDLTPEEPTDLVELTDDESMPIGELPTAAGSRREDAMVAGQHGGPRRCAIAQRRDGAMLRIAIEQQIVAKPDS